MLKKLDSIVLFTASFLLAVSGLFSEIVVFLRYPVETLYLIRGFLGSVNLGLAFEGEGIELNFLNISLYFFLLLGAVLYPLSKFRETRLLRVVLSIILFQNLVFLLLSLFSIPMITQQNWVLIFIVGLCKYVLLIYLSYTLLNKLQKTKELDIEFREADGETIFIANESSRMQRFFHMLFDSIIYFFMLLSLITQPQPYLTPREPDFGFDQNVVFALSFLLRFSYYSFFEIVFKSTPGKFFTESRVIKNDGLKLGPEHIFGRNLARFIPFNSFSFFARTGWHDLFSGTTVVREIPTGAHGAKYLWIVPGLALVLVPAILGYEKYNDQRRVQRLQLGRKTEHDAKVFQIQQGLEDLSTSDIIQITPVTMYDLHPDTVRLPGFFDKDFKYYEKDLFIKVEKIEQDSISTRLIVMPAGLDDLRLGRIERFYLDSRDTLLKLRIGLDQLRNCYTPDYEEYKEAHRAARLIKSDAYYEIKQIARLFEPSIHLGPIFANKAEIELRLENWGWPAQLVELSATKGNIKWTNEIPCPFPSGYPSLELKGNGYKENEVYELKLTLLDSMDRKHRYLIKGTNLIQRIERLK